MLRSAAKHFRPIFRRCYGPSKCSTPEQMNLLLEQHAQARSDELMSKYIHGEDTEFPKHALPPNGELSKFDALKKRLIHRSQQRGFLELDTLMSAFAKKYVPDFTVEQVEQYELIMSEATMELYNVITCKSEPKAELDNDVLKDIQHFVQVFKCQDSVYPFVEEK
eukprot:TRINITY_DN774472_c0_g1_i1.p1 TRINITY_DN774472_c0_g1~~TRINITY_DN774472_c0_g1_i1.p1  ORF type:complete len:165 (+),score=33.96 TRINITY_DN774472_c0_g1_i1:107-601(+)